MWTLCCCHVSSEHWSTDRCTHTKKYRTTHSLSNLSDFRLQPAACVCGGGLFDWVMASFNQLSFTFSVPLNQHTVCVFNNKLDGWNCFIVTRMTSPLKPVNASICPHPRSFHDVKWKDCNWQYSRQRRGGEERKIYISQRGEKWHLKHTSPRCGNMLLYQSHVTRSRKELRGWEGHCDV